MALASPEVHLAGSAWDPPGLLVQKSPGLCSTGRNRSDRRGRPSVAVVDLVVVVMCLGFDEAGKCSSARCGFDL